MGDKSLQTTYKRGPRNDGTQHEEERETDVKNKLAGIL